MPWTARELYGGRGTVMVSVCGGERNNQQYFFAKVPIYDVVPKEFKYTPTLTLENPNPDYGATVEFKNPNNRAFINLDDQTSTLRLGFVDNENNAGQFKGIGRSSRRFGGTTLFGDNEQNITIGPYWKVPISAGGHAAEGNLAVPSTLVGGI